MIFVGVFFGRQKIVASYNVFIMINLFIIDCLTSPTSETFQLTSILSKGDLPNWDSPCGSILVVKDAGQ